MDNEIPIRSVSRFIALFREINLKGPLSLGQMVQATRIPYPTTSRVVQTMLTHELIERIPGTKSYCVAAMALSLSHGFQSANRLAAAARPAIEALTERIGWPIVIMTRVGTSMIARASTHHRTSLSFGPCPAGTAIPILHSASGHVFLAHAPMAERAGVLAGLQRFENRSPMLSLFVDGRPLDRIRADGHATYERNPYTQNPGKTSSISVPIFDRGDLQGTLTLVFFSSAMPMSEALRRFIGDLEETAMTIEDVLARSPSARAESERSVSPRKAGRAPARVDTAPATPAPSLPAPADKQAGDVRFAAIVNGVRGTPAVEAGEAVGKFRSRARDSRAAR